MEKRIKSVAPVYLLGAVFMLYAFIFPVYRPLYVGIAVAVSVVAYIVGKKLFKDKIIIVPIEEQKPSKTGILEADTMLLDGKKYIIRLKELDKLIKNIQISSQIENLLKISEQIFAFIIKNPEKYRKLNTFMDYYYPTALKLLESYVEFDSKAVRGSNIKESLAKISESISKIEDAFSHQLDNLYSDKALDIKTDIKVLENIMAREGVE